MSFFQSCCKGRIYFVFLFLIKLLFVFVKHNWYLLLLLFCSTSVFSQLNEVREAKEVKKMVEQDKRIFGEEYTRQKIYTPNIVTNFPYYKLEYNEDNSQTTLIFSKKKRFNIVGKWNYINLSDYNIKYYVSHCPSLIDKNGVILEYGAYDVNNKKKSSNELLNDWKMYYDRINADNQKFTFVKYDSVNNFYFFKKKETNALTNDVTDVYYLRGVKNGKDFYLALFNFNEEDYDGIDKFLEDCYIKNR